jgi:hypothetical protein
VEEIEIPDPIVVETQICDIDGIEDQIVELCEKIGEVPYG